MEDHRVSKVPLEKLVASDWVSRYVDDPTGVKKVDYLLNMAPHY
jgi:hypothetical protein